MAGASGSDYPESSQKILEASLADGILDTEPADLNGRELFENENIDEDWNEEKSKAGAWIIDCINRGRSAAVLGERVGFGKV